MLACCCWSPARYVCFGHSLGACRKPLQAQTFGGFYHNSDSPGAQPAGTAPLLLRVLPQLPLAEQEPKPGPGTQDGRASAPSLPGPASLWGAAATAWGWPWAGDTPAKLPGEQHRHWHRHRHRPIRTNQESTALPPEPICVFKLTEVIPVWTQGPQQSESVAVSRLTRLRLIHHFICGASGKA